MNQSEQIRFAAIKTRMDSPTSILDIGCVRHSETKRDKGSLHDMLIESFPQSDVIGIDILPEEVEKMRQQGYNVEVADAELMSLDREFDTIVAGEVIEHLANPGEFLRRVSEHLTSDGKFIMTTPNPDGFPYWRKAISGGSNNPTHTLWIDPRNLRRLTQVADTDLSVSETAFLPPTGGISGLLWRAGFKRGSSPVYIAELQRET